jgi:hypothetical protein
MKNINVLTLKIGKIFDAEIITEEVLLDNFQNTIFLVSSENGDATTTTVKVVAANMSNVFCIFF